ncbi:MAG: hypothetical protein ACXW2G_08890 [Burkholderiaceae bacterium]
MSMRGALFALLVALTTSAPAHAVAPPVPRATIELDFRSGGDERVIEEVVRPYQPLELTWHADAGAVLLLWLTDTDRLLVLHVVTPSGVRWIEGAQAGPDGLRLNLVETGVHRMYVAVSTAAARAGKAEAFRLRMRLLN